MKRFLLLFTCYLLPSLHTLVVGPPPALAQTPSSVSLLRVSPSGNDVPPPAQLIFEFSAPVVPLGRMERSSSEIGITISPQLACQWRWLSVSTLACNLNERELPAPATRYTVSVPTTFDTTQAVSLQTPTEASFTTSRPAISSAWVTGWSSPGSPAFSVTTNQGVSLESLTQHLALQDPEGRNLPVLVTRETPAPEQQVEQESSRVPPNTRWTVTTTQELSLDTSYNLTVSPGLVSLHGKEPGIENRAISKLHTFPKPAFLGVSCRDLKGSEVWIPASSVQSLPTRATRCDPLNAIQIVFNSPILKEQLRNSVITQPKIRTEQSDFDPWEDVYSYSHLQDSHQKDQRYAVNLPYGLKAFTEYSLAATGSSIHDEFGRPLSNDIAISFTTDHRNPRYVLDNSFSVLEKDTDSQLPVVVNNVDSIGLSYQRVTASGNARGITRRLLPYKAHDIAYRFPIDVRSLLGGASGVIQGRISTKPKTSEDGRWFFSQVTPFGVHVKLGHFNSLAWVTSLQTGNPVEGAAVSITADTLTNLSEKPKTLASAVTDGRGIAALAGLDSVDPKTDLLNQWEPNRSRLIVRVDKDGDVAFIPLSWDLQVYGGEMYPSSLPQYGHMRTWGTTAQGLYKAGDTVQFSLWVRNQDANTLTTPPLNGYKLQVLDPTDTVVFEVPNVTLSEFGQYSGEFTTRHNAAVGWYRFVLRATFTDQTWQPLRVLISDFTPAPFQVTTEVNAQSFKAHDRLEIATQARLHAGGPYSDAPSRVNVRIKGALLRATEPRFDPFTFDSDTEKDVRIYEAEEKLDPKGDRTTSTALNNDDVAFGDVIVESAVRDDRGKSVASFVSKPFLGRDRYVGLAQQDWILNTGKEAIAQAVVIDTAGRAAPQTTIHIEWFYEETKAARVKSAGNAYIPRYEQEFVSVKSCDETSTTEPVTCHHTPVRAGRYRITAEIKDSKGRQHTTSIYRWASGTGDVLWSSATNDDLPIVPEKKSYKVGETARFFIRNPFPGARALLTTERYGIQKSWTETWRDSSVIVELPITADHIPGFFFSATVMSPRVDKPIENQVDLGKPSFKLGYAQIEVKDPAKELVVTVQPNGTLFKPRETVHVDLEAHPRQGGARPTEFAVTVLDEAVFDLIAQGRNYFDPYKGFYELSDLDVRNYNLIKMLIGRQHFEKKGASPGGDGGGKLDLRSLQKFVSYWNPAVKADADGKATITFETPDNLTSWKVFAIAVTPHDQVGLGDASFKVNKEVEVRSALPNQARVADTFNAVFTVMNRTEKSRVLNIEAKAEGAVSGSIQPFTISAEPFRRYPVIVPVRAERHGTASFSVRAHDAEFSDALTTTVPIMERAVAVTAATFGSSHGNEVTQAVEVPKDIIDNEGSIGAVLSPTILGGLQGSFSYMKDYPYECWEQRLSKAVMAAQYEVLKEYLPTTFTWPESTNLVQRTLAAMPAFQAPNGGMSFYTPRDEYSNRYLSAYTALALSWLRALGQAAPPAAEEKLSKHLLGLLRNDDFPEYLSKGYRASIRAVILAALAPTQFVNVNDLNRLRGALPTMSIFGKAHYLSAATTLKAGIEVQREALNLLLSHGNETSATYSLTEPNDANSDRILESPMRAQCAALNALIHVSEGSNLALSRSVGTIIPKLVRTITLERTREDRWENTQENLFCMTALANYSRVHENPLSGLQVAVQVDAEKLASVAFHDRKAEAIEVSRPLRSSDAGRSQTIRLSPHGSDATFYYSARLSYTPREPAVTAHNAGIEVSREYSVKRGADWILLANPISIKQGELVRVDIYLKLPAARHYVVVDDPVPGGLEAVNRELATSSQVDAGEASQKFAKGSRWWFNSEWIDFGVLFGGFYHQELRHSAARFYSEYLPPGNYHLSYISQAIAAGSFMVPPTRAEEMYDPDVSGSSSGDTLNVESYQ